MISNQIKIIFFKKMNLISNQDQRSFFVPKVTFLRVKISNRTKSRLWTFEITLKLQFIHGCHIQKRTVTFVMKHKQHNDPQYADYCSATRAELPKIKWSDLFEKMAKKMILDQIKRSPKIKWSYKFKDHDIFDLRSWS
jgi:hypothetical protein